LVIRSRFHSFSFVKTPSPELHAHLQLCNKVVVTEYQPAARDNLVFVLLADHNDV